MAVQFTASSASGYMTNPVWFSIGPLRAFTAHYSSPGIDTYYVDMGTPEIVFANVQDADPTTYQYASNGMGGQFVYFSGLVTGSTGYIFIMGM